MAEIKPNKPLAKTGRKNSKFDMQTQDNTTLYRVSLRDGESTYLSIMMLIVIA